MHDTERSFAAFRTFADEHIERWALVYLANPHVARRGVLFETFLLAPEEILAACSIQPAMIVCRQGLLKSQRDAQARIDLDAALVELGERAIATLAAESHCSNGVWVEKLKHSAWPRYKGWRNRKLMEV